MTTVRFDLPTPEADTIEFWEAAKQQRLLIRHCLACGAFSYYPRPFCPRCWSERVEWHEASGQATLYTWSVIHSSDQPPFRDRVPYVAAIVDLPDKVSVRCTLIDVEPDPAKLPFGLPVKMITKKVRTDKEGRDVIAFFFTPEKR